MLKSNWRCLLDSYEKIETRLVDKDVKLNAGNLTEEAIDWIIAVEEKKAEKLKEEEARRKKRKKKEEEKNY